MSIPIAIRKNKSHFKHRFLAVSLKIQFLLACFSFSYELILSGCFKIFRVGTDPHKEKGYVSETVSFLKSSIFACHG